MRFHFHVVANGERVITEDGSEFTDLAAARRQAVASAREIMAQRLRTGQTTPADLSLIITDAQATPSVISRCGRLGSERSNRGIKLHSKSAIRRNGAYGWRGPIRAAGV